MKKILTLIVFVLCLVTLFGCTDETTNTRTNFNDSSSEYYITSNSLNYKLHSEYKMNAVDLNNENVKNLLNQDDKNKALYLYEGSITLKNSASSLSYNGSQVNKGLLLQIISTTDKNDSSTYLKVPGVGSTYKNLTPSTLLDYNQDNIYYGAAAKEAGTYDVLLVVYENYTFALGLVKTEEVLNVEYNELYDSNNGIDILPSANNLASSIQEGVILHAWNWSYKTIEENLDKIAAAGYTSVQVSPVQQPKDYDPAYGKGWATQWWKFYQPVSYSVSSEGWLGTKAELTSLCQTAKNKGIFIVVDVVANHSGNVSNDSFLDLQTPSEELLEHEPELYNNQSQYYREYIVNNDSSIEAVVRGQIGMPDLKTESPFVQEMIIDLLKECIDCGVTGFRFDAAKHIETPDDGAYASDFWPNVIGAAESYAESKNFELYCYGEILNTPGNGRSFSSYTKYMSITDNKTGNDIRTAIKNGNVSGAASNTYKTGEDANKLVLWAESHDTYANDDRESTDVTVEVINKTWAMVASRKDATALYFARPGEIGSVGSWAWMNNEVACVNKFHNQFIGANEEIYSFGDYAIVERYSDNGSGAVIVNVKGNSSNINLNVKHLANGTYTDEISGNVFTVNNGVLTGNMGSTGIVVLSSVQSAKVPVITLSQEGGYFTESLTLTVNLSFATEARVIICGEAHIITETTSFTIKDVNNYDTTKVIVSAINDNYRVTKEYEFLRFDGADSSSIVVKGVPKDYHHTADYELYAWVWQSGMEGRAVKVEIVDGYIIFNVKPNENNFLLATHKAGYSQFNWLYVKDKTNDFLISSDGNYTADSSVWVKHVN